MSRSKHSPEFRAKVSQEYIDGIGSVHFLANKYVIGYSTLRGWINEIHNSWHIRFLSLKKQNLYKRIKNKMCGSSH